MYAFNACRLHSPPCRAPSGSPQPVMASPDARHHHRSISAHLLIHRSYSPRHQTCLSKSSPNSQAILSPTMQRDPHCSWSSTRLRTLLNHSSSNAPAPTNPGSAAKVLSALAGAILQIYSLCQLDESLRNTDQAKDTHAQAKARAFDGDAPLVRDSDAPLRFSCDTY